MMNVRYNNKCGHPNDAILYMLLADEKTVKIYSMGCIFDLLEKHFGLKPSETMPLEEFATKYLGVR